MKCDFANLSSGVLSFIVDVIESEDRDVIIDVYNSDDVVSLTTPSGVFVINKHSVMQEIWLASPISGPYHFKYKNRLIAEFVYDSCVQLCHESTIDGLWVTRDNLELYDVLSIDLLAASGIKFKFITK